MQTEEEVIDPLAAALMREARLRDAIEWFINVDDAAELSGWQNALISRAKLVWNGERWVDDPAL